MSNLVSVQHSSSPKFAHLHTPPHVISTYAGMIPPFAWRWDWKLEVACITRKRDLHNVSITFALVDKN
jgi:hypothetical protein